MKLHLSSCILPICVLFVAGLVGCGSGSHSASSSTTQPTNSQTTPQPTLQSIAITSSPSSSTLHVGTSEQFTATGTYSDGSTQNITNSVTWVSSNPAAIIITAGGLATAVNGAAGSSATISATLNGVTTTPIALTVSSAVLNSISVSPAKQAVPLGSSQQFLATGNFSDGTSQDLTSTSTWTSSATTVATISAGLATPVALGSTNITATFGSLTSNTAVMTVTPAAVKSITVYPVNLVVGSGATWQYWASAIMTDGTFRDVTASVTWSSSSTAIASVTSPGGLVTTASTGGASITATDPATSVSASSTITVGSMNPAKLTGQYMFNFQAPGGFGTAGFMAGSLVLDGNGNITGGVIDSDDGTTVSSAVAVTGTYTVGPDSRGAISVVNAKTGSAVLNGNLAVQSSGRVYITGAGPTPTAGQTGVGFGEMLQQSGAPFGNSSVTGNYAVKIGAASAGYIGQFTSDGAGNLTTGTVDSNLAGVTTTDGAVSGTYAITDSTYGRGTATITTPARTLHFALYAGSSGLYMVSTDASNACRGVAVPQTGGPYSTASDWVWKGASSAATFAGEFANNGAGAWTGSLDVSNSQGISYGTAFTATYSADPTVTSRFSGTERATGFTTDNFGLYMVNATEGFTLDESSQDAALGEIYATQGPFSVASLNGSYSFHIQGCNLSGNLCTTTYAESGVFTADGAGNVTFTYDRNSDGALYSDTNVSASPLSLGPAADEGSFTFLDNSSPINFYFVDPTHLFLIQAGTTQRGIGTARLQQ